MGSNLQKPSNPIRNRRVFEALPFDLAFTAEQGKVRVAFNSLLIPINSWSFRNLACKIRRASDLRSLAKAQQGSHPESPGSRGGPGANTGGAATARGVPSANELDVILGRELVKASLRVEIIDFSKLSEASK